MPRQQPIKISQLIPYTGSFIIFLGVLRLTIFYEQFGVKILDYIEFSEIITSFLDITILAAILILVSTIQNFLIQNEEQQQSNSELIRKIIHETNFFKIIKLYVDYLLPIVLLFLTLFGGNWLWQYFHNTLNDFPYRISVYIFLSVIVFLIVMVETERRHKIQESSLHRRGLISICIFLYIFVGIDTYIALNQATKIKQNKSNASYVINLENNKILKSDSNNYYIGHTKTYLFFYHERTQTTEVYPMSKLVSLSFKNDLTK